MTKKGFTLNELREIQIEIDKDYPDKSLKYLKAVEESNKKIHEYEQEKNKMYVKASKFVALKGWEYEYKWCLYNKSIYSR